MLQFLLITFPLFWVFCFTLYKLKQILDTIRYVSSVAGPIYLQFFGLFLLRVFLAGTEGADAAMPRTTVLGIWVLWYAMVLLSRWFKVLLLPALALLWAVGIASPLGSVFDEGLAQLGWTHVFYHPIEAAFGKGAELMFARAVWAASGQTIVFLLTKVVPSPLLKLIGLI
jgi:hypothetical protein